MIVMLKLTGKLMELTCRICIWSIYQE